MKYSNKLKDPRWQKKRLEIMSEANFKCSECGDDKSTLNVHHTLYFKNKEPWDYGKEFLVCLCDDCHKAHHHLREKISILLSQMDLFKLSFVCGTVLNVSGFVDRFKKVQFLNSTMAEGFFCAGMVMHVKDFVDKTAKTNGLLTEEMLEQIISEN